MRLAFLACFFLWAIPAAATIHYVRPTGDCTNAGDGTTPACAGTPGGAGAYKEFPATGSLIRGDVYMAAGSTNFYAPVTFADADSGTAIIYIYKAVDCTSGNNNKSVPYCSGGSAPLYSFGQGPQTQVGWTSGMGTNPAEWKDTWTDPQVHASANVTFTKDYYIMDGVVGTTDPAIGPSGQGFMVAGQGGMLVSGVNHVTLRNIDDGGYGLMPFYRSVISSCSYAGGSATIGTATNTGAVNGDKIGAWTLGNTVIFTNVHATTASSSSIVVVLASNPCPSLYPSAAGAGGIALDYIPSGSIVVSNSDSVTVAFCYIHDAGSMLSLSGGDTNFVGYGNYEARNRSTPTYHANTVNITVTGSTSVYGPITLYRTFYLDNNGSAVIENLGQSTNPYGGILQGLYVFSSVLTCSSTGIATLGMCGTGGGFVSDDAAESVVKNAYVFNNTFGFPSSYGYYGAGFYLNCAGTSGERCFSAGGIPSTGSGWNNIFYNNSNANSTGVALKAAGGAATGFSVVQAYNSLVFSSKLDSLWTCSPNSPSFNFCNNGSQTIPFTDIATYNFAPLQPFVAAANSNNQWAIGNCSPPAPFNTSPYNQDFYGTTFGSTVGCARGAIEYGGAPPPPPGAVGLSSTIVTFGAVLVGTANDGVSSDPPVLILTNTGGGTLTITSIVAPTGFTQSNTCGGSLASLASCTITVIVAQTGTPSGNLVLTSSAPTSPDNVALSATGVRQASTGTTTTSFK